MKSCIILCGGKSTRMGQDKGSLILNDKPMIVKLLDALNDFFDEILIILRDDKQTKEYKQIIDDQKYPKTSLRFFKDIKKDQGPLMGIMTGLFYINSDYALVLPCDAPYISDSFLKNIFNYYESKNLDKKKNLQYDALVPQWDNGNLEPLHAIYKKKAINKMDKLLKNGVNDVKSLIQNLNVLYVNVERLDKSTNSFSNINKPEDIISY
ncbi:MAG: molybdenum cofactor guanylyltransferase [Methanomicrobiales archaeon]